MAIPQYLAMTAAEMALAPLPPHPAWMACHFSPYSTGLTNLPPKLRQGSLLILNDRTPIHCHDPERVCRELNTALHRFGCVGLLVDFQNPVCPETRVRVRKRGGVPAPGAHGCGRGGIFAEMGGPGNLAGSGPGRPEHRTHPGRRGLRPQPSPGF